MNTNSFNSRCFGLALAATCLASGNQLFAQRPPLPPGVRLVKQAAEPPVSTHQRLRELASVHPICVVIGEGLATSFVCSDTVEEGPFEDYVMGAKVQGVQKTNAHTSIDFTPDAQAARMLFVLKGISANQSVASVPQAAIRTAGTFEFELTKQIEFNGHNIRTWSPSAFMTVRQRNLGASTAVSNVPLLGPLANNIVMNAAEQRKPMSESIAAQRVTQQVAPQLNSRLDQELGKLNDSLHGPIKTRMVQSHLLPSHIATLTTNDAMLCGLEFQSAIAAADASGTQRLVSHRKPKYLMTKHLIAGPGPLYGSEMTMIAPEPFSLDSKSLRDRACLLIHASFIQDLVERYHLAGREIPDTQLQQLLSGTPPSTDANVQPQLYTLLLAKEDPVTAVIEGGELVLSLRVGFRPVIGPELPTQVIKMSIHPKLTENQILLKPEVRSIEPLRPDAAGQLGAAGTTVIRGAIEQRLKEFTLNRNYNLPRQNGQADFPMRIQNLTLVDGWITTIIEQAGVPKSVDAEAAEDEETKVVR